ncbi:hypothetical protein LCGC14_2769510 [marine sediment metagenome]|uniref:Uncharacterized protein n=1 Tax=marine sediment metagenome TaxID=412755 RepID=A0A0F9B5D2_9ZZZZ
MTHRAVITRNTVATTDAWNRPDPPTFTALKTVACRAWSKTRKHISDDGKETLVEDLRALFPKDADIQTGDRVTVNDRRGTLIFDSLAVLTVSRKGANVRHSEVVFERHK